VALVTNAAYSGKSASHLNRYQFCNLLQSFPSKKQVRANGKMKDTEEPQASTSSTIGKFILVCLLCIGIISGLVYIIQLFN